jgi:signal transduction histidine kinase
VEERMSFPPNLNTGIIIVLACIIWLLLLYINRVNRKISYLKRSINYLENNLKETDHQAKLIIKSDMKLKLYQDAVNDKLQKLSFLKNFISSSLGVLDRDQLFSLIDVKVAKSIGFEKTCLIAFPNLELKVNTGFSSSEVQTLKRFIRENKKILISSSPLSSDSEITKDLREKLSTKDFLIGPITMDKEISAVLCLGGCILTGGMSEAEKEIFSIVCMYLSQSLENIKSFESLYRAGEELENKIKEKTFQLTKSLEEIENISKMKSEFISSVSHELRTPLTSIKGFSSLLVAEKFGKLPPQAKERLKKVDDNVNKLVDMVNTLLDISRIESKKIEINIGPQDLSKLAKEVTDFLMPQMEEKKIKLNLLTPPTLMVYMDKNLIERVFINLINNAIKFTPPQGEITVKCIKEKNKALISVADTGCGMSKSDLEKIFQEFFRADNPINRQVRGTGLGLSLVKRIIDTHKSRIWVESEPNKGTTFYFTLELAENV